MLFKGLSIKEEGDIIVEREKGLATITIVTRKGNLSKRIYLLLTLNIKVIIDRDIVKIGIINIKVEINIIIKVVIERVGLLF